MIGQVPVEALVLLVAEAVEGELRPPLLQEEGGDPVPLPHLRHLPEEIDQPRLV